MISFCIFLQKKRTSQESILSNLEQYGLKHKYLDVVVMDNARPFWREITYVDAIITDRKFPSLLTVFCFIFATRSLVGVSHNVLKTVFGSTRIE